MGVLNILHPGTEKGGRQHHIFPEERFRESHFFEAMNFTLQSSYHCNPLDIQTKRGDIEMNLEMRR